MNEVAKQFWSEVLDLHSPVSDEGRGGRKASRRTRKTSRRTLANQVRRTSRPAA